LGSTKHWKLGFGGVFLGVAVLTVAAGLPWVRRADSSYGWLILVVGAELLLGAFLFLLIDRTVFRPVSRLHLYLSLPEGGIPPDGAAGPLDPLVRAVEERLGREREALEEKIRAMEGTLREVEALRRDNEETRAHLEAKIQDLQSIYEIATAVAGTLDMEEIFRIIPERIRETMGLKDFCLLRYDPEIRMLTCRASAGMTPEVAADIRIAPGDGISGRVFETGEPVYIPDVRSSSEFLYGGRRTDVRSFMCVPLLSKGRVIGVMNVNHPEPSAFDAESLATMRVLATHIAIAIENAELFQFVRTLAEKDSLTLLYNHGAFHEKLQVELERASRYGRPLAVMMLDLDNFKSLNDTYGHLVGDRVLVMTAGVLCAHLRKSDIPARYGGDEFAVILPETDLEAASAIASRIAAGITRVRVEPGRGEMLSFSVSIGYAACRPDSRNRQAILSVADRLMYESKRRGRGGVLGEQL
jgi:diguanylate cyclase (GGDEF)-like protein